MTYELVSSTRGPMERVAERLSITALRLALEELCLGAVPQAEPAAAAQEGMAADEERQGSNAVGEVRRMSSEAVSSVEEQPGPAPAAAAGATPRAPKEPQHQEQPADEPAAGQAEAREEKQQGAQGSYAAAPEHAEAQADEGAQEIVKQSEGLGAIENTLAGQLCDGQELSSSAVAAAGEEGDEEEEGRGGGESLGAPVLAAVDGQPGEESVGTPGAQQEEQPSQQQSESGGADASEAAGHEGKAGLTAPDAPDAVDSFERKLPPAKLSPAKPPAGPKFTPKRAAKAPTAAAAARGAAHNSPQPVPSAASPKKAAKAPAGPLPPLQQPEGSKAAAASKAAHAGHAAHARQAPSREGSDARQGPKPMVRPKPRAMGRGGKLSPAKPAAGSPPKVTSWSPQAQPPVPLLHQMPAVVFPTAYVDYGTAAGGGEGSTPAGYSVAEFGGLQWGYRPPVQTASDSDWSSLDQVPLPEDTPMQTEVSPELADPSSIGNMQWAGADAAAAVAAGAAASGTAGAAAGSSEGGEGGAELPSSAPPLVMAEASSASLLGPDGSPKPGYSTLHRNRSTEKALQLQRGQQGYVEVEPDEMFRPPPPPEQVVEGAPAKEEEELPPETPRGRKQSKPSVHSILAKAGVKVKTKPEPQGLRTAPPQQGQQQLLLPQGGMAPMAFPPLPGPPSPNAALAWGAGAYTEGQLAPAPFIPGAAVPAVPPAAGSPGLKKPAVAGIASYHHAVAAGARPGAAPAAAHGKQGAAPPQQDALMPAQDFNIPAGWEGGMLPTLSPEASAAMVAMAQQPLPPGYKSAIPVGGRRQAQGALPVGMPPSAAVAYGSGPAVAVGAAWQAMGLGGPAYVQHGAMQQGLPPLPGAAAAAWAAGPAMWAPHAGAYDYQQQLQQQQEQQQQHMYAAAAAGWAQGAWQVAAQQAQQGQRGILPDPYNFVARPSKAFLGVQARTRPKPVKYQEDGRPEFTLK